jgi:hypothetical protein
VEAFSGDQTYKDKAFAESAFMGRDTGCRRWRLARAISVVPACLTGVHCGEQSLGPFDFSLGLGWGYLGTSGNIKNPLCTYKQKFCYRDNSYNQAGSVDASQMFHGPTALLAAWNTRRPGSRCV